MTSIGNRTFFFCRSLAAVDLPDKLSSLGSGAFYFCTSLTAIDLPDVTFYVWAGSDAEEFMKMALNSDLMVYSSQKQNWQTASRACEAVRLFLFYFPAGAEGSFGTTMLRSFPFNQATYSAEIKNKSRILLEKPEKNFESVP